MYSNVYFKMATLHSRVITLVTFERFYPYNHKGREINEVNCYTSTNSHMHMQLVYLYSV